MKATELITLLKDMIEKHGDLEVYSECDWSYVHSISADKKWDENGQQIDDLHFVLEG
jgi:hypothetical protein